MGIRPAPGEQARPRIHAVGWASLPVLIHPEFWNHRRLLIPGRDPVELPTTSRRALEGAGFTIIEEREPQIPARSQHADHRRGRQDIRVRARVPATAGATRWAVGTDPRCPTARPSSARAWQGPDGDHRLRA